MPKLKRWVFETTTEYELGEGETVTREIKIPVWPSKDENYNWETVVGRNLLRFKTKKTARKNLKEIV